MKFSHQFFLIFFILLFSSTSFILALEGFGIDDPDLPKLNAEPYARTRPINYSLIPTVNATVWWITTEGNLNNVADIEHNWLNNLEWSVAGHTIDTDFLPDTSLSYDIGSGALRWRWLYVQNISAENIDVSEDLTVMGEINSPYGNFTDLFAGGVNITNLSNVYVPYTGAIADVNLGGYNLTAGGSIKTNGAPLYLMHTAGMQGLIIHPAGNVYGHGPWDTDDSITANSFIARYSATLPYFLTTINRDGVTIYDGSASNNVMINLTKKGNYIGVGNVTADWGFFNNLNVTETSYLGSTTIEAENITAGNFNGGKFYGRFNISSADDWIEFFDGNTIDFNESKLSTQFFNASTIQVITGTPQGTITDLQSYNNIPYNVSEDASDLELRINFTGIEDFNQLIIRYKSVEEDEPHTMYVQIWDYVETIWEGYGVLPAQTGYNIVQFGVYDKEQHIGTGVNNGVVQIRFYQDEGVPAKTHKHNFDWVSLAKGFGTPAGQEVDPDFNAWFLNPRFEYNVNGSLVNSSWDWINVNTINVSGTIIGPDSNFAQYQFTTNNFNGSGNFITTGTVDTGDLNASNLVGDTPQLTLTETLGGSTLTITKTNAGVLTGDVYYTLSDSGKHIFSDDVEVEGDLNFLNIYGTGEFVLLTGVNDKWEIDDNFIAGRVYVLDTASTVGPTFKGERARQFSGFLPVDEGANLAKFEGASGKSDASFPTVAGMYFVSDGNHDDTDMPTRIEFLTTDTGTTPTTRLTINRYGNLITPGNITTNRGNFDSLNVTGTSYLLGNIEGEYCEAAGLNSVALGYNTTASGHYSFVAGRGGNASGNGSMIIGFEEVGVNHVGTIESSGVGSVAIGYAGIKDSGPGNKGYTIYSTGQGSIALGQLANASGLNSVAFPGGTASGSDSLSIGPNSISTGTNSIAIGPGADSTNTDSISIGKDSVSANSASVALGRNTNSYGVASLAMGYYSKSGGTGAVGIGYQANATGTQSISLSSSSAIAEGDYSLVAGNSIKTLENYGIAFGKDYNNDIASSFMVGFSKPNLFVTDADAYVNVTNSFIVYNSSGYGTIEYGMAVDHTPSFLTTDFYDRLVSFENILDENNKVSRFDEELVNTLRTDYSRPETRIIQVPQLNEDLKEIMVDFEETYYPHTIETEGRDTSKSIDINRIMIANLKQEIEDLTARVEVLERN